MLAVITGTGIYKLGTKMGDKKITTQYGKADITEISLAGEKMFFLPRHGRNHTIPPHMINYKANIAALGKLGVTGVISVYSAGIISKYKPGDLVLVDDFIGLWTPITFFDDFKEGMRHMDFTRPFSKDMRAILTEVAAVNDLKLKKGGVIGTTPGPRFETKAEVKLLKKAGANLVNMTSAYEMTLLREAEIDFASIVVAANYGTGISKKPLSDEEVLSAMTKTNGKVITLLQGFVKEVF